MKLKFTALEVNEGDSFLLEYKDSSSGKEKRILVDGGTNVDEVLEKAPAGSAGKFIDLIICTHYDKDHIDGILKLLDKGYQFSELWLPDKIKGVGDQLRRNGIFRVLEDVFDAALAHIESVILFSDTVDDDNREKNQWKEKRLSEVLEFGKKLRKKYGYWEYMIYKCLEHPEDGDTYEKKIAMLECVKHENILKDRNGILNTVFNEMLDITIKVCKMQTIHSGKGIIRWMTYTDNCTKKFPSKQFPVWAMNSIENVSSTVYFPTLLFLLEYRRDTSIKNHESLVFMYRKEGFPDILFSGDSDYSWLWKDDRSIQVKPSSIVTSPHHGSGTGKAAYSTNVIYYCDEEEQTNANIVFVRSDSVKTKGNKSRPCKEYEEMAIKYCTFCGKNKRIILEYDFTKKSSLKKIKMRIARVKNRRNYNEHE